MGLINLSDKVLFDVGNGVIVILINEVNGVLYIKVVVKVDGLIIIVNDWG